MLVERPCNVKGPQALSLFIATLETTRYNRRLQPLAILFGAAFTTAVCLSSGTLLLRERCTDPGIRFVTGAAVLSAAIFTLCAAGLAYPSAFLCLGAAIIVLGRRWGKAPVLFESRWWWLAFAPFLILYLSNAMAPEISYDGSRYHLGLVGRYLREHGFHPVTDTFYAALSQGVEMLYLFAYAFGRHSAAAMVHFAFLLALTWQMISWSRRAGVPLVGVCAAFLVFASPVVGVDGTSAYNDVAVAAIAFTLFHLLENCDHRPSARLLAAIGLTAGFAYAAKYTAAVAIPYAMAVVAWRTRRWAPVVIVAACAGAVGVPWVLKDWLWYRNPFAPFFNHAFPNPLVSSSFEADYLRNMQHYNLASRWEIPLQVTVHGSLSGLLGPVFLLAPLALFALRRKDGRRLLFAAAVFGSTWFFNISTRFLIPALPFVALAMCLVLVRWPRVALAVMAIHAVLSWPDVVKRYCRFDAWHLAKVTYREALRIKPEDGFLESNLPLYGAARLIERATPPGATVFAQTPIPEAYTSRHIQIGFQAEPNIRSRGILWSSLDAPAPARAEAARQLRQRGIDYLLMIDGEYGADVLHQSAADWGMREVGDYKGARLYQLP
jgi:hypothetical protein